MPYPVPPPPPPPLVNTLPSEDSHPSLPISLVAPIATPLSFAPERSSQPTSEPDCQAIPAELDCGAIAQFQSLPELPAQDLPSTLPDLPSPDGSGEVLVIPERPAEEPPVTPAPTLPVSPTPTIEPGAGEVVPLQPLDPSGTGGVIELRADRQEYNEAQQVFNAEGNVEMRFSGAILTSDRLQVNLPNRVAVAEGDVILTRGDQVLRGNRFVYNFVREEGTVFNAGGDIFLPTAGDDFTPSLPTDVSAGVLTNESLSDRVIANQPVQRIVSPGGISITVGGGGFGLPGAQGQITQLRFEAERIDFTPDGWQAQNARISNDPFSPPELELRANEITFTRLSPTLSEIRARRPRLVFDQGLSIPLLRSRVLLDRRERNPAPVQFGFDDDDRGGFYLERSFEPIVNPAFRFTVTPEFYVQRAIGDNGFNPFEASNFGLSAALDARLDPRTVVRGTAVLTGLDLDNFENRFRASLRAQRRVFDNHQLSFESSYRDRLFNGSLGFQNVQSSIGFLLRSPSFRLGDTGIGLSYQVGAQYINANTDRADLLPPPPRDNNRISLGRLESSVALSRGFTLWSGTPLAATPEAGLRYSPVPLVPYVQLFTGLRGVAGYYTNGDSQSTLTGTVGVQGQFGHFARDFLDYTAFSLGYSQRLRAGESPFLFDRAVDDQVLSLGLVQQLYGPFRLGVQTSLNLETNRAINTNYILEYRRRTYALTLRYNPVRQLGSLGLQINDFNWTGNPGPFSGAVTGTVEGGVRRREEAVR